MSFMPRPVDPWGKNGTYWVGGWAPEPVWMRKLRKKIVSLSRIEPRLSDPIVGHYKRVQYLLTLHFEKYGLSSEPVTRVSGLLNCGCENKVDLP